MHIGPGTPAGADIAIAAATCSLQNNLAVGSHTSPLAGVSIKVKFVAKPN